MKDSSRRISINAGLALTLAMMTGIGWLCWWNMRALNESARWESHTHYVIEELSELLSAMREVETGQRGFIITGEPKYLEPYHEALGHLDAHLASLRKLTRDNPHQQTRLNKLEPLVRERLRLIKRIIDLRSSQGFQSAAELVAEGSGKKLMDEIRRQVADAQAEEDRLLQERIATKEADTRKTVRSLGVGGLFSFAVLLLVFTLLRRELARRLAIERDLRANRDHLAERTAQLQASYQNLETLNAKLEVSNRELQDFAFVASHDLQEPLRKVMAFGDVLAADYGAQLGETGLDYLRRMQAAARRMQALISDLLQFSRVTTKAQPFSRVDLKQVAEAVLSDLEVRIQEHRARVEVGDLPAIDADPMQMRQLLQNLIGNALKFARPEAPPQVLIYAEAEDGLGAAEKARGRRIRLCVADNGIGFEEKYLDRIFTVFQRLHGRDAYEGTGIGLAICRKIVERHGGSITARSQPGEGSTFIASLPLRQPS